MGLHETEKLLHSKGNRQQNEKATYQTGSPNNRPVNKMSDSTYQSSLNHKENFCGPAMILGLYPPGWEQEGHFLRLGKNICHYQQKLFTFFESMDETQERGSFPLHHQRKCRDFKGGVISIHGGRETLYYKAEIAPP